MAATTNSRRIIGADEVDCHLADLGFYSYINPLKHGNYSTYKGSFTDKEFPLEFISVTHLTQDSLSAFMQLCSEYYRRCSFRDKQRLKRLMHKRMWRSGRLWRSKQNGSLEGTEFADIDAIKSYFRENEEGDMDKKYLKLLSLIYKVDTILIEPFGDEFIQLIGSGDNDCICILNLNDEIFVPVVVNGEFYHNKGNIMETLRYKYGSKQRSFTKLPIKIKDTEDVRRNTAEIEDSQPTDYIMEDIKAVDDVYADRFYRMLYEIAPII